MLGIKKSLIALYDKKETITRKEFWSIVGYQLIVIGILVVLDFFEWSNFQSNMLGTAAYLIAGVFVLVNMWLGFRRLREAGFARAWAITAIILFHLLIGIGWVLLVICYCMPKRAFNGAWFSAQKTWK